MQGGHGISHIISDVQWVPYQKEGWPGPFRQFFFWYDNDKDLRRHVFAALTSLGVTERIAWQIYMGRDEDAT